MNNTLEARRAGAHRKQDNSAKRRFALVAVAASAVTTAGAAGATAGAAQSDEDNIALTSNTTILAQGEGAGAGEGANPVAEAPQILEVPQAKPVSDLASQLDSALRFAEQRIAADLAARAPISSKPAEGSFTSPFGPRWGTFHKGIDIANAVGTPILAVADGLVIDSGPAAGFGNWIRVQHDDGTITVYGHMVSLDVTVGQRVTAGQKIAGMGNEGFSTGSHLHFEVHPAGGDAIDPVPWLAARGIFV
ncbi:MAG TPA: M23 family metallopeptidase [Candidatus Corynebacterium gallistercoris]|uniref:M23 family metallopeptidase n=1 Tax=Candidatus Corynebacterium gallistercoris TaxID=2838530 RepID=A0A9D1RWR0_9CORY|nr:M23 family metallopeptidase [Candidatus Corynebacterium gallistercoris]